MMVHIMLVGIVMMQLQILSLIRKIMQ